MRRKNREDELERGLRASHKYLKSKCDNPLKSGYTGHKYQPSWKYFDPFRGWALANGYEPKMVLKRYDLDEDYTEKNCYWDYKGERSYRRLTLDGETKTLREWSIHFGLNSRQVIRRINQLGWSPKKALQTPSYINPVWHRGEYTSLRKLAEEAGLNHSTVLKRVNQWGWSLEKALTTPVRETRRILEYGGQEKSLAQWARDLGLTSEGLRRRIDVSGWPLERALTTPSKKISGGA